MSKTTTTARMHPDGTLHRRLPDGTEHPMSTPPPIRPMTDEQIKTAALQDPDAHPLTEADMARLRRIRRALGLT